MPRSKTAIAPGPAPGRASGRFGRLLLYVTLLLCPLVFSASTLEAFEFPKTLLLRAVALGFACAGLWSTGAAWLAGTPVRLTLRRTLGDPVAWAALGLLAAGAASSAASLSPRTSVLGSQESFAGLLTLGSQVVLFFAFRASCAEPRHYGGLLPAVALSAAGAAGYSVIQGLGLDPITWTRRQEFMGLVRGAGTMGNATFLGGFLATTVPLVALLAAGAARRRAWAALGGWLAIVLLGVAGVGVTLTRGAWLALAGGFGVMALGALGSMPSQAGRRRLVLAGGALAAVTALGAGLFPPTRGIAVAMARRVVHTVRVQTQELPSGNVSYREELRPTLWRVALQLWRDHPGLGVGLDAFQLGYLRHRSREVWSVSGQSTPQNAHNELLQALATQGLAGGSALLAAAAALAAGLRRAWRRAPAERPLVVAVAASLTAAGLHLCFSFTVAALGLLLAFLAALVSRLAWPAPSAPAPPPLGRQPRLALAAVATTIALILEWSLVLRPLRADLEASAGVRLDLGRPGDGLTRLRRAVELDPGRDGLWTHLGISALSYSELLPDGAQRAAFTAESRQAFERAAGLVPANAYHHLNRGRALLAQALARPPAGTADEVAAAFDEALRLDPRNPYISAEAGRAALGLGDTSRVLAEAERCRGIDADFGACEWLLANLSLELAHSAPRDAAERQRLLAEAGDRLKRAASMRWYGDDSAQALAASQGAAVLVSIGHAGEAKDLADLAVYKAPDSPEARYHLGRAWEALGRLDLAAEAYRAALTLAPGHRASAAALHELAAAGARP